MGETLYLAKIKDEGILFYYNRPARRFHWDDPPSGGFYALLIEAEWHLARDSGRAEVIEWLTDQQGGRIFLARFRATAPPGR